MYLYCLLTYLYNIFTTRRVLNTRSIRKPLTVESPTDFLYFRLCNLFKNKILILKKVFIHFINILIKICNLKRK